MDHLESDEAPNTVDLETIDWKRLQFWVDGGSFLPSLLLLIFSLLKSNHVLNLKVLAAES
jgi:hypothetical protein